MPTPTRIISQDDFIHFLAKILILDLIRDKEPSTIEKQVRLACETELYKNLNNYVITQIFQKNLISVDKQEEWLHAKYAKNLPENCILKRVLDLQLLAQVIYKYH